MWSSKGAGDWSLRRRLAWQLTLAIGLLLGGLFLGLDALVDRAMYRQLDTFLQARGATFAHQLEADGADAVLRLLPAYDLTGHTEFFSVYDRRGRLRIASANSGLRPLGRFAATDAPRGDVLLPDGHAGRAIAVPLVRGPLAGGHLVVATERESWDATERRMHVTLLGGVLLAIAAAVAVCLWLVRLAFRTMAVEAERLPRDEAAEAAQRSPAPRELQPFVEAAHDALRRSWQTATRERRFSRDVAHELRTPVAEIRATAELALHDGSTAAMRDALARVLDVDRRMARGIDALLALARHESGQDAPTPDPLDLGALVRQQLTTLATGDDVPTARFELDLASDAWVHSDPGMIERIVANLLQNAVDYADAGTPVRVSVHRSGDGVRLVVRNRASRIGDAEVARFGERHWRAPGGDSDGRHAGLGLALSQALARALGVDLTFRTASGDVVAELGPLHAL